MNTILLVRHGDVPGIQPERFRGRTDLPLTPLGLRQASATAQRINCQWHPCVVYASPLQRCVTTGQMIADACGIPRQTLDGLIDLDYGEWRGRTVEEVRAVSPQGYRRWRTRPDEFEFPGGESLAALAERMTETWRSLIVERPGTEQRTAVVVGHDSGNRVLLLNALGLPLSAYWRIGQDPCGISELAVSDRDIQVRRLNDSGHLLDVSVPMG